MKVYLNQNIVLRSNLTANPEIKNVQMKIIETQLSDERYISTNSYYQ